MKRELAAEAEEQMSDAELLLEIRKAVLLAEADKEYKRGIDKIAMILAGKG
jgi:hypothetical protein